jgi:hypothetical protein
MTLNDDPAEPITVEAGDHFEPGARIVELDAPAPERALARLRERLADLGMSDPAAAAVARAVSDPAGVRRRIGPQGSTASPGIIAFRVPGGKLLAFHADVNALAIGAWPVNPRQASRLHYPIEVSPGSTEAARYAPLTEIVSPPSVNELLLNVENREHAVWAYDRLIEYLKELNDLAPRIAKETVVSPVVLAPATIKANDDADSITLLTSVDGSSRITAAQRILGVTGVDVLYRFPSDRRALNDRIAKVRQVYDRSEIEVTEEEVERARVLNIPAFVIVGFEPDHPDVEVDFATAVRSYIGLTHVDPPKPWDEAGRLDTYAAAVLDALRSDDRITHAEHDYYAGLIPVNQLKEKGFADNMDARAARLVHLALRPRPVIYEITGRAIRRVSQKSQARQELRLQVFCELVLRSVRSRPLSGTGSVLGLRSTLQRTYSLGELTQEWKVTKRKPSEILADSLEELSDGKPGPSARELAVRGAYWLIGYEILVREGPRDKGPRDTRRPSTMLSLLMRSQHGLYILRQAINDGRKGLHPRIVDDTGNILRDATGQEDALMSADWLRRIFPADEEESAADDTDLPDETPTAKLERRRKAVVTAISSLQLAMANLANVRSPGGAALIDEEGMPPGEVDPLRKDLRAVDDQLVVYRSIHQRNYPPAPSDDQE